MSLTILNKYSDFKTVNNKSLQLYNRPVLNISHNITPMEVLFQNFTDGKQTTTTTVDFDFFELRQFFMITPIESFIEFMDYMTKQITKYNLKLDIDDFVMDCYSATDTGLFYNPNAFDRYQEPEDEYNQTHTQYYGSME